MNMIDYIQIGLLVLVVPALIFVWIYIRRKEIKKIDEKIEAYLKITIPQPMQEQEKTGLRKNYILSFVCGFFLIGILCTILTLCVEKFIFSEIIFVSEKSFLSYSIIKLTLDASRLILGILFPLIWIFLDKKRIQTKAKLVKLPAYVHSTSSLSSSFGNRTAYLVYYDRKKDRLRAKTVTIKQFESENGRINAGECVLIAVEERNSKMQFVNIFKKTA